jgi:DNA invertase Pin-like site-specific DNA recombinase
MNKVIEKQPILITAKINTDSAKSTKMKKLKVCAYCRVSTDKDEQLNSYENQVDHYENYIKDNKDWEYVGIFADEAVSGTSLKNRTEFKRMIQECLNGKIDMILVKSIARFGRNTADILQYVRLLRDNNVAIYFETERINTLNSDGEVLLSIFSSLAQDESRQTSERVNWGNDKSFKKGKVYGNGNLLGYDISDGKLIINEQQAEVVRFIFNNYIDGDGTVQICRKLEKLNIKTVSGKNKWSPSTLLGILKNEKYCGHLLQQKYYTTDYLSHKSLKNKGEKRQYLFEKNHDPIISQEIFNKVQEEIERRRTLQLAETGRRTKHSNKYPFSGMLECGKCKESFRRTVWHNGKKYERVVWECMGYVRNKKDFCDASAVIDSALKEAFVLVYNDIQVNKEEFLEDFKNGLDFYINSTDFSKEINIVNDKINDIELELSNVIKLKSISKLNNSNIYDMNISQLENVLNDLYNEKEQIEKTSDIFNDSQKTIEKIKVALNEYKQLDYFNEKIFKDIVSKIIIIDFNHYQFILKSGQKIEKKLAFKSNASYVLLDTFKCEIDLKLSKCSNLKNKVNNQFTIDIYFEI